MHYRPMRGGRLLIGGMFLLFAAAAVFLLAAMAAGGDDAPSVAFTIFWLAALAWNAYWWLFRIAAELTLEGDSLTASSPLRVRKVSISGLVSVRPMRLASNIAVIEVAGERSILTVATKGLKEFSDELARRRPDLPIRLGWQARLAERLPGWSRTQRR